MSTQIPVETASGEVFYVQVEAEQPIGADTDDGHAMRGSANAFRGDAGVYPEGEKMGGPASKVLKPTVFSKAVGVIRGLTQDVSNGLMAAHPRPDQVELEFSLGLGASGNVMIFKGDANASFKLKLTWKMPRT